MEIDGENVRTTWTVEVTAEDIEKGIPGRAGSCMFLRALHRAIPEATHLEVDAKTIRFSLGNWRYVYVTTQVVEAYVTYFDDGERSRHHIEPFKTRLQNPRLVPRRRKNKEVTSVKVATKNKKASRSKTTIVESLTGAHESLSTARAPKRHKRTGRRTYGSRNLLINQLREADRREADG